MTRRSWGWRALAALVGFVMGVLVPLGAVAQAPTTSALFRNPAFEDAKLSPDGKKLAVIVGAPGKRMQLAVLELGAWDKVKIVASFANADVSAFNWVNDKRLVLSIADYAVGLGEQAVTGLYGVDVDGSAMRYLSGVPTANMEAGTAARLLDWRTRLHSTLSDGSDDVVVAQSQEDGSYTTLLRLNTRTGIATSITLGGPKGSRGWVLDRSGRPAWVTAMWDGVAKVARWDKATSAWVEVARWQALDDSGFMPFFVGYDDELYVVADANGYDALYRFDPAAGKPQPQPLMRIDGFDLGARQGTARFEADPGARKILGVHFTADAPNTYWFDPEMKKAQAKIDAQLPGTVNRISCGRCLSNPYLLVFSVSDREPGTYYVYEVATGKLERVFRTRPWLDARQMGKRDFVRLPARDGKTIPAWITLPPDFAKGKPRPAVVLVHGGPHVRGASWLWNEDAQFLATRGYVVIEPEFRGSAGFGRAWLRAGFKQWGLAMQDDLVDAARWLAAQGYADSKRVCIAGASYGGYAALMGLARDGDLYRCAVSWVAVTDLDLLFTSASSDATDQARDYEMPVVIGDRRKDAERLRATSPAYLTDRITGPLLLAYGGEDRRVPIEHGRKFYNAIAKTNPQVEWVLYPDEGHGWLLEANRYDFYGRVEKFLARHLKDAAD